MGLGDRRVLEGMDSSGTVPLGRRDCREMVRFYRRNYPQAFLTPDRLIPGFTFGVRRGGKLVSAAGTFLLSVPAPPRGGTRVPPDPTCSR